jgi:thiol-disulfide isomerase/thioredoxin
MIEGITNMDHILFLNKCWGVDFSLMKQLERAKIKYDYVSLYEEDKKDTDLYAKYQIRSTPLLLILDNGEESDRLSSLEEIVEYLKNVSDTKI